MTARGHCDLLNAAARAIRIIERGITPPAGGARSYLADGRMVIWNPGAIPPGVAIAVDAELADQPVPPHLSRQLGISEPDRFWAAWTDLETRCKLAAVPVLVALTTGAPEPEGYACRTLRVDAPGVAVVVTCATARSPGADLKSR